MKSQNKKSNVNLRNKKSIRKLKSRNQMSISEARKSSFEFDQCTFTAKWKIAFRQQLLVSAFQFSLSALGIADLTLGISDLAFSSWHFHAFQAFGILVLASVFIFIGRFNFRHFKFGFQLSPFRI